MAVYGNGEFVVTVPAGMRASAIEQLIATKSAWVLKQLSRSHSIVHKMPDPESAATFRQRKEEARLLVRDRLAVLNELYRFAYNRVAIRNQKTRWGSCSKKGNLNFNYRIASLPLHLADYVIVHELCHLSEFNHSPQFWNLVARAIPDHSQRRKELRGIPVRVGS